MQDAIHKIYFDICSEPRPEETEPGKIPRRPLAEYRQEVWKPIGKHALLFQIQSRANTKVVDEYRRDAIRKLEEFRPSRIANEARSNTTILN